MSAKSSSWQHKSKCNISYGLGMMRLETFNITLILLFIVGVAHCQAQQNNFLNFSNCRASSTYGEGFEATKALQAGGGYWASSGHHSDDEEITWTGQLPAPSQIKGIKVRWAYSPEEVAISVSPDGLSWHLASPYKRTPSNEVSFVEDIQFPHVETAKAIMIQMRKSIHDFFGINNVSIIGGGEPILMIISGVTSEEGEMCLQVAEGKIQQEGAPVVLDLCSNALAMADGRELWIRNENDQFVSAQSYPPLCMTLQDGRTENGGKIVLVDCIRALEESDGRSNWNIEANSQLRLQKAGSYCLTQRSVIPGGSGVVDIAQSLGATVKCESLAGTDHTADKALDRDLTTYWASGAFENAEEQFVQFEVDLGKPARVSSVRVDWEYPALSYKIETSEDGKSYTEMAREIANPSNSTLDMIGMPAQHIRIELQKPHPTYGKIGDKYVYGIREVYVEANRMESAIGDCREAANSDDCRDKYFPEFVSVFDATMATKVESMDRDVLKRVQTVSDEAQKLTKLIPQAKSCLKEKQDIRKTLDQQHRKSTDLAANFQRALEGKTSPNKVGLNPGDSAAFPAVDCSIIKEGDPEAPSGFYWILPRCAPEPLRVFCDMKTSASLYFWNGSVGQNSGGLISSRVESLEDIRLHCAEIGMEPLIIKSNEQLRNLVIAASQMGYRNKGRGVIPLAYDYGCLRGSCTGTFHDLYDGSTDLTSLVITNAAPNSFYAGRTNVAGLELGSGRTTLFNLDTSDIAAIVCSTNSVEGEYATPHIDITCEATARNNEAFQGGINTNIVARCPAGCEENSRLPVFGTGGVYSDASSICRAAIHAGIIKSGGLVNVSLESSRSWFEGSVEHGIESKPLNKSNELELVDLVREEGPPVSRFSQGKSGRSIRIGPVAKDCPIEVFNAAPSSFVEMESAISTENKETTSETPNEKKDDVMIDPMIAAMMEEVLQTIGEMHGVAPSVVYAAQVEAANAVREARKIIKPAEILQKEESPKALQTYSNVEDLASGLYSTAGGLYNSFEEFHGELEKLEDIRMDETGFSSFKVEYKAMPFTENFVVHDSLGSKKGPSDWGYSESPVAGHKNSLGQTSNISGNRSGRGTFAMLKGHRFFDTVTHFDLLAQGNGSIGVAFRMRDFQNMYLVEFNREEGVSNLIRIENGNTAILAQRHDGSIEEGKWYRIRIETTHGYIKICMGPENGTLNEIFNVLDEKFISGTIGFYSSGMRASFFDNIRVKAKSCSKISRAAPPLPPRCARFTEEYFKSPDSVYEQIVENEGVPLGVWVYTKNFEGRKKVLSHVRQPAEIGSASFALVDENKKCHSGHFSFDFLPLDSIVGALFRYISPQNYNVVEISPTELHYRIVRDGDLSTITSIPLLVDPRSWNTLELRFDGPQLTAVVKNLHGKETKMQAEIPETTEKDYGRVGILSRGGGAAFDNIQLSPSNTEDLNRRRARKEIEAPWGNCANSIHLIQRRDECQNMLKNEPDHRQVTCAQNFCTECCLYNTKLLGQDEKGKCEASCKNNEELTRKIASSFIQKLKQCVSAEGDAFEHCSKDDASCKLEACHFCCETADGPEDMKDIPIQMVQGMNVRETDECKYQCGAFSK